MLHTRSKVQQSSKVTERVAIPIRDNCSLKDSVLLLRIANAMNMYEGAAPVRESWYALSGAS